MEQRCKGTVPLLTLATSLQSVSRGSSWITVSMSMWREGFFGLLDDTLENIKTSGIRKEHSIGSGERTMMS